MKKSITIRIVNIAAILLHLIRFVLGMVAVIGFFGEAEGSLWPTQFIAVGCAIAAIVAIYFIGKLINWLDRVSNRLIRE